jgi:hypothetical protein
MSLFRWFSDFGRPDRWAVEWIAGPDGGYVLQDRRREYVWTGNAVMPSDGEWLAFRYATKDGADSVLKLLNAGKYGGKL